MSFDSIISEAVSVYTEVTSILASDASNTASSTSSSVTTTSSSSSTTSSSASTLATSTSSTPISTTSAAAAAVTNPAKGHSGGGLSGTNLAIILGCVLGALVLGLLALVLVLCCRRRRRNSRNSSPRLLSPDGDEIESWRHHKNRPQSREGLIGRNDPPNYGNENGGMPNMTQHPAFANDRNHQNPFVPIPPAPRRSAPNSRAGLTDGSVPGQEPFITKSNELQENHHHGGELAAGAGGAALGAAALHHHEKNKDQGDTTYPNTYDEKPGFTRRSLPADTYPTTTTNDDAYALNKIPSRRSGDGARPYNGDDYGYSTGPYEAGTRGIRQPNTSAPLSPFNGSGHHRGTSGDNHALMAAGAGALGGAALANQRSQRDRSSSAPRRSYDSAKTPGPNALLHHHPLPQERDLVSPISSDSYSSASGIPLHRNTYSGSTAATNTHHIPSEMPGDVPPTPSTSSGGAQRSSFGTSHSRERPTSGGPPPAAALAHRSPQIPLPSRSPRRSIPTDQRTSEPSSEDSTWRLSSGMPSGWGRAPTGQNRRDSSPSANSAHLRNAGINPLGRGESPIRAGPGASGQGNGTGGRRLRLADLKREEEKEMMMRGRESEGMGEAGGVGRAM